MRSVGNGTFLVPVLNGLGTNPAGVRVFCKRSSKAPIPVQRIWLLDTSFLMRSVDDVRHFLSLLF